MTNLCVLCRDVDVLGERLLCDECNVLEPEVVADPEDGRLVTDGGADGVELTVANGIVRIPFDLDDEVVVLPRGGR